MKMMIVTFGLCLNSRPEQKLWNYLQNRDIAIKIIVFLSPPGRINGPNSSRFIKCHFCPRTKVMRLLVWSYLNDSGANGVIDLKHKSKASSHTEEAEIYPIINC